MTSQRKRIPSDLMIMICLADTLHRDTHLSLLACICLRARTYAVLSLAPACP